MKRRKTITALWVTIIGFVALVVTWFALNHFRVQFYNSAMEGPSAETSPYWTIIRIQAILEWLMLVLTLVAALLILIELARKIALIVRH
jgi:hypothetical protein